MAEADSDIDPFAVLSHERMIEESGQSVVNPDPFVAEASIEEELDRAKTEEVAKEAHFSAQAAKYTKKLHTRTVFDQDLVRKFSEYNRIRENRAVKSMHRLSPPDDFDIDVIDGIKFHNVVVCAACSADLTYSSRLTRDGKVYCARPGCGYPERDAEVSA